MTLVFRLKKSPEFVFEYLSDMQKFVSVHPVIKQINPNGNGHYLVHETLNFLGISISFTYPAHVEVNKPLMEVSMRATVMKLAKIDMKFVLKRDKDRSLVEEHIQFRTLLPVKFLLRHIFKKQHTQLFKNIETKK